MPRKQAPIIPPSPATSPVNWTAGVTAVLGLITSFGLPLTDEQKVNILTVLIVFGPAAIGFFRTFMPGKEATAPQLKAAIEDKKAEAKS